MQVTALGALILKSSCHHIVTVCASEVITSQHILKRKGCTNQGTPTGSVGDTYMAPINP